jgi:hypothetical protein
MDDRQFIQSSVATQPFKWLVGGLPLRSSLVAAAVKSVAGVRPETTINELGNTVMVQGRCTLPSFGERRYFVTVSVPRTDGYGTIVAEIETFLDAMDANALDEAQTAFDKATQLATNVQRAFEKLMVMRAFYDASPTVQDRARHREPDVDAFVNQFLAPERPEPRRRVLRTDAVDRLKRMEPDLGPVKTIRSFLGGKIQ